MGEYFEQTRKNSMLDKMFQTDGKAHKFYSPENILPFNIDPDDFVEWVASLDITLGGIDTENDEYDDIVAGMCEFGALYIVRQAYEHKLDPKRVKVCYGAYHIGEHYWILLDDEWFVDLTLRQFQPDAPKIAITHKDEAISVTKYEPGFYSETYMEYLEAFGGVI